jgi:RND family efflux transporter MFP subunit
MTRARPRPPWLAPAIALVALSLATAASRADGEGGVLVTVAPPRVGRIAREVVARGTIERDPTRTFALTAPDAQPIEWVGVVPGQRVARGEVLVRVHLDPAARLALEKAEIARGQAALLAGRVERLVRDGVLPQVRLDDARAALALAEADARAAREALEYARGHHALAAPIDGVVDAVDAVVGALSDPSRPLVRVVDPAAVYAALLVPLADAAAIHTGEPVVLEAPTTGERRGGVVAGLAAGARPDQALLVRVVLAPGASPPPPAGAFVTGRIEVAAHEGALLVPPAAVVKGEDGGAAVFVVREGKAARIAVEVGLETRDVVEVTRGLGPGDQVVVEGAYELEDGAAVTARAADAPASAPGVEGRGE